MKKVLLGCLSLAVAVSLNAKVLATVGDMNVTDEDLAPLMRGLGAANFDEFPSVMKKKIVDRAIEFKLLSKQAVDSGIENTPEFKKELNQAKLSIATRLYQQKQFENIKISEDEIKKFYNDNKKQFDRPQTVSASHILVKTQKEADAIIKKLKATKPADLAAEFKKLALKDSIDPSAKQNGGNLGSFPKGSMVKPFNDAVFAMKVGTFSQKPIKTQYGYHIIYKTGENPASVIPFSDAKAYIEVMLKRKKFQEQVLKDANDLRMSSKVVYTFDTNSTK